MSKVKEMPYHQGYEARRSGARTRDNPYWEGYENGHEYAFHAWLNGWSDKNNECIATHNALNERKQ